MERPATAVQSPGTPDKPPQEIRSPFRDRPRSTRRQFCSFLPCREFQFACGQIGKRIEARHAGIPPFAYLAYFAVKNADLCGQIRTQRMKRIFNREPHERHERIPMESPL